MKSLEEHIEYIMESFDWETVQKTAEFLGVKWVGIGTPTIEDMKHKVTEMMVGAHGRNGYTITSGGFSVSYYYVPTNNQDIFRVMFVISKRESGSAGLW